MGPKHGGAEGILDDIDEGHEAVAPPPMQRRHLTTHHPRPVRVTGAHEHRGPGALTVEPHEPALTVRVAREGADVAIGYLPSEKPDANDVKALIEAEGRKCVLLPGDISGEKFCQKLVADAVKGLLAERPELELGPTLKDSGGHHRVVTARRKV